MISRDELRQLKAKLLTYCSENDLFDDYNVEGLFDIVAERFMTSDFETFEKEINEKRSVIFQDTKKIKKIESKIKELNKQSELLQEELEKTKEQL